MALYHGSFVICCGKGNNGGDGLVAARLLREEGQPVRVVLPFDPDDLSPDARANYHRAVMADVPITPRIDDETMRHADVVVDALLGTGVSGPATGVLGEIIAQINRTRGGWQVLSVDLPSGVNADTGAAPGAAVQAEETLTLALAKVGLALEPGKSLAGMVSEAEIGIPEDVLESWPADALVPEREDAHALFPERPAHAHKRSAGFALAIAGSAGMTGAAAMSCLAAYRVGAGLVRLALPAALVPTLNPVLPQVVCRPMPGTPAGTLGFRAVACLLAEAHEVDAALIGPGLSRNRVTQLAIQRLIAAWPGPLVVDADALTAAAADPGIWAARQAPTIITPHPGEMSRLLGMPIATLEDDRPATARAAAERFGVVVVYKGANTIIAAPGEPVVINPTGNAALAVAGTGDVLAGAILGFLAQGMNPREAAVLACYVGGLAAERYTEPNTMRSMTAPDLVDFLPEAMRIILRHEDEWSPEFDAPDMTGDARIDRWTDDMEEED